MEGDSKPARWVGLNVLVRLWVLKMLNVSMKQRVANVFKIEA
jgi:hypothetical protein